MEKNFIDIDDVIINNDLFEKKFTCDLEKCKGACCTMKSEYGAPLTEEEISKIDEILPVVKNYIPDRNVEEIEDFGFWEDKFDQLMTRSINNMDCVFVYYEGDIAKCGIEKAFFDGKVDFRKPISCHLFPIRVSDFGGDVLRFEEYSECKAALKKGLETNLTIFEFCKDALKRLYGNKWFEKTRSYLGK